MARKLRTKKGRETYSKRMQIVEPVFGQIKGVRGFRRFLLRGLCQGALKVGHYTLQLWNILVGVYPAWPKLEKAEEWRAKLPQMEAVDE